MKKMYAIFFAFALLFVSTFSIADTDTTSTPTPTVSTDVTSTPAAVVIPVEPTPVAVAPAVTTVTPVVNNTNTVVVSDPSISIAPLVPTNVLKNLPGIKSGFLYDWNQNRVSAIGTIELVQYKNFSLEAGYSGDNTFIGVISYPLFKLKDYGVTVPILNMVECNVGIGLGITDLGSSKDNNFSVGPTVSLINLKF